MTNPQNNWSISETRICRVTGRNFVIRPEDKALYEQLSPTISGVRYSIPLPTQSPFARQIRRILFTNPNFFAKRVCPATGTEFISNFTPERPENIVSPHYWHSDAWNPLDYGRVYSSEWEWFFKQFFEIYSTIPLIGAPASISNENCPYSWAIDCKNSYFLSIGNACENVYYSTWILQSRNVVESSYVFHSDNIAYSHHVERSQNCTFLESSSSCIDCHWGSNLQDCSFCLFSTNLRHKKYYVNNEPVTPTEYERYKADHIDNGSYGQDKVNLLRYNELLKTAILPDRVIQNSEDCVGDRISNCNSCYELYDSANSINCHYSLANWDGKDCIDASPVGAERCMECISWVNPYHCLFCMELFEGCSELMYCHLCTDCQYCFGCIGLKHKKYHILNIAYTEAEYFKKISEIISEMTDLWEWGEFFPEKYSPFGYNRSTAHLYQRLSKEEALTIGYPWSDHMPSLPTVSRVIPANLLPDNSQEIPEDVVNWAIECKESWKLFRITAQEFELYNELSLSLPRLHPEIRRERRQQKGRGQILFERKCDSCGVDISTPINPVRPEKMYCHACYSREFHE